jgi:hypothetical protein
MCMLIVYGVSMMLTGSRRLTRLVSTLMDVSRLEAGRLKGSFRLVNLGLVTRDLAVSLLFENVLIKADFEALFRGAIERVSDTSRSYRVKADDTGQTTIYRRS